MFYWLLYEQLYSHFSPFRVFRYITFRTAFASMTALFLCLVLGPWLIGKLRQFQIGQHIREDGPTSHQKKAGTPTMGGVLIVISIVVPTLLWANLRQSVHLDRAVRHRELRRHRVLGRLRQDPQEAEPGHHRRGASSARSAWWRWSSADCCSLLRAHGAYSTAMNVPFFKRFKPGLLIEPLLGNPFTYLFAFVFFFVFLMLVIVGTSNAVNLTDGLDGLAIGLMLVASAP